MPKIAEKVAGPVKRPLRELVEQTLLHHLGVSAALVKANGDILYLHGRTGLYLEPSSGEAGINNILKMARVGLRHDLAVSLQRVVATREIVHAPGVSVKTNGHFTQVELSVCPVISSTLTGVNEVDAQAVHDSLESRERQVQTTSGSWFIMRIRPYRTLGNVIEGVVITFVDITETKHIEEALAKANDQLRLAIVVRDSSDAITVHDLEGRIIAWNPSAVRMYGWSEAEALSLNVRECAPELLQKGLFLSVSTDNREEPPQPLRTKRLTKDGRILDVWVTVSTLVDASGETYAFSTTERLIRSIAETGE